MSTRGALNRHYRLYVDTFTHKVSVDVRAMLSHPELIPINAVTVKGIKYDTSRGFFEMEELPTDGCFLSVKLWDGDTSTPRDLMMEVKHIDTSKLRLPH